MFPITGVSRRRLGWPVQFAEVPDVQDSAPYGQVLCDIPAYAVNGNQNTIHPSVLDFGTIWNGYRWWMANTPYPPDADEQPVIYASNDMTTWTTPLGLINPIDPAPPGSPIRYNSDTELAYEDGTLICYYREAGGDGPTVLRARTSTNGVDWSGELTIDASTGASQAVTKNGTTWLMIDSSFTLYDAPTALGPWSFRRFVTQTGGARYHGSIMDYRGTVLYAWTDTHNIYLGKSTPDLSNVTFSGVVAPTTHDAYRCTMALSPKPGYVDIWAGGPPIAPASGPLRTWYTRVPLSAFGIAYP